jgi:hypothetical protein
MHIGLDCEQFVKSLFSRKQCKTNTFNVQKNMILQDYTLPENLRFEIAKSMQDHLHMKVVA